MKSQNLFVVLIASILTFTHLNAQESVKYEVLHNNPDEGMPNFRMRLNIWTDVNTTSQVYSSIGLLGDVYLGNRIGINYDVQHSWFTMAGFGGSRNASSYNYEIGGIYLFGNREIEKEYKVVLKVTSNSKTWGNTTTTSQTQKFIMVPNTKIKYLLGARAGLYLYAGDARKNHFDLDKINGYAWDAAHFTASGIYIGIMRLKVTNLKIKTDNYGECGGGMVNKFYADLLFTPLITATAVAGTDQFTESRDATAAIIGKTPIGIRIGIENTPGALKEKGLSFKAECGYRPGIGSPFFGFGLGFRLLNRKILAFDNVKIGKKETEATK